MALTPQFGSLVPTSTQQLLATNYLQFNTGAGADFAQQYLPEIYEQEVERYGNRTLSGFLRMVGAEMPMTCYPSSSCGWCSYKTKCYFCK